MVKWSCYNKRPWDGKMRNLLHEIPANEFNFEMRSSILAPFAPSAHWQSILICSVRFPEEVVVGGGRGEWVVVLALQICSCWNSFRPCTSWFPNARLTIEMTQSSSANVSVCEKKCWISLKGIVTFRPRPAISQRRSITDDLAFSLRERPFVIWAFLQTAANDSVLRNHPVI